MINKSKLLVLQNCTVFDGVSEQLLENMEIVIEGDRIIEILPSDANLLEHYVLNTEYSIEYMNVRNGFVMPGLIDAHFHCNSYTLDMAELDSSLESYRALQAGKLLNDTLFRGFTTVRDAAGADFGLVKASHEGLITGPRIFSSGKALSQTGGHGDLRPSDLLQTCGCGYSGAITVLADGEDEVRKTAREQLRAGAHQLKIFVSGGVLSPTDPIWMPQFTRGEIRAIVEEAETRNTYVMAHSHTSDSARRCAEEGVRSIEHGTLIDKSTAEYLAEKEVYVVPTLVVMEGILSASDSVSSETIEKLKPIIETAYQAVEHCIKANVKLGFGTDLFGELHGMENKEFELRGKLSSPIDVLRSATSINAELMKQDDLGVIKVGAYADILVLDESPLNDLRKMEANNIRIIIKSGKVVKNEDLLSGRSITS